MTSSSTTRRLAHRTVRRPAGVPAAVHVVALVALYAVALGTEAGRALDGRAMLDAHTAKPWAAHWTVSDALQGVAAASFALMGVAVALLRRRDVRGLAAAALLVGGATATAQLLKPALGALGVGGHTSLHALAHSFPSGHAATTLALALAVAGSVGDAWRTAAGAFAVAASIAVGSALVTLGWHYPSDVVGGFLVAGAWAGVTRWRPRADARPGALAVATLAVAGSGLIALPWVAFAHLIDGRAAPPAFGAGVAAIAVAAIVVTAGSSRRRPALVGRDVRDRHS